MSGPTPANYQGPKILTPFARFAALGSSSGILLMACTVVAMAWANSPWHEAYFHLWETPVVAGFGSLVIEKTLHHWINDGLMAVFFFAVGLEIKRELMAGELSSAKKAILPIAGALGGMLVPAAIYFFFNAGGEGEAGWGIPMATDIAFAIGVLTLVGSRVPLGLKIFLTALAIVDDIGAVLVIALFYTTELSMQSLLLGGGFLVLMFSAGRLGFRSPILFALLGVAAWLGFLQSGIHATVAGVLGALMIPSAVRVDARRFAVDNREALAEFERATDEAGEGNKLLTGAQQHAVATIEQRAEWAQPPMQRLEHLLLPWVNFFIMPVFAFANAGVRIDQGLTDALFHPVSLGIVAGLVIGKQLGITAFSLAAVKMGIAALPERARAGELYAVSWLGGIGFTMSLFIANLAFDARPELLDVSKVGILAASLISGLAGWAVVGRTFRG